MRWPDIEVEIGFNMVDMMQHELGSACCVAAFDQIEYGEVTKDFPRLILPALSGRDNPVPLPKRRPGT